MSVAVSISLCFFPVMLLENPGDTLTVLALDNLMMELWTLFMLMSLTFFPSICVCLFLYFF